MSHKNSHDVIGFLRSIDCEYVTRTERVRFRDQVIEASETMRREDVERIAMMRQANYVSHGGRYLMPPTDDTSWRIVEDLSPGALPRAIAFDVEWRPATPDEEARARAHHTGRWHS